MGNWSLFTGLHLDNILAYEKNIFVCVWGGGGIDYGVKDQTVLQVRNGSGKQTFGTSLFSMIHRLSVIVELKM
jgi:hypothetical protein